jgi:hypothetical protein
MVDQSLPLLKQGGSVHGFPFSLLPGITVGVMACQHFWPWGPALQDFTDAPGWKESCCPKVSSFELWYGCHHRVHDGRHKCWHCPWSQQEAGLPSPPAPQPAWPPPPGRAAKLPAASKAYCSAVTRNDCRAQARERLEAKRGGAGEPASDSDSLGLGLHA